MITRFLKKLIGKSEKKEDYGSKLALSLRDKGGKFYKLVHEKYELAVEEFFLIKEKCADLRTTNYNLGLKHLTNGKIPEAIFRFRFIKKFWPTYSDAYFQLAYCLALKNKNNEAKKVLLELLHLEPNYNPKAQALLDSINIKLQQPSNDE